MFMYNSVDILFCVDNNIGMHVVTIDQHVQLLFIKSHYTLFIMNSNHNIEEFLLTLKIYYCNIKHIR